MRQAIDLRDLASRVTAIQAGTEDACAIKSFLAGALYALDRSAQCGFDPSTATSAELDENLRRMSQSDPPSEGVWLAGFYFNSALQRMAVVLERGLKVLTKRKGNVGVPELFKIAEQMNFLNKRDYLDLDAVREEVNRLKHDVPGLIGKRKILTDGALAAAHQAVTLLELVDSATRVV